MYNLLSVGGNYLLAQAICRKLGGHCHRALLHTFSDGEILHNNFDKISSTINDHPWIIFFGVRRGDVSTSVLELLTVLHHLHRRGAVILALACFYLPYCRQHDCLKNENQPSTLRYLLHQFCQFNILNFIFLDVHDESIARHLKGNVHFLSMTDLWCEHIRNRQDLHGDLLVISPDAGSMKRSQQVAKALKADHVCMQKIRHEEEIEYAPMNCLRKFHDCLIIIVDDIIDQGRTLMTLLNVLDYGCGCHTIVSYVTHGVLSKPVIDVDLLLSDGSLVMSNSIDPVHTNHGNNCVDVSNIFANAIRSFVSDGKFSYSGSK